MGLLTFAVLSDALGGVALLLFAVVEEEEEEEEEVGDADGDGSVVDS